MAVVDRCTARRLLACALLIASSVAESALTVTPLSTPSGANAAQPALAADRDGGFILTWQEKSGDSASLRFAKLDPAGKVQRSGLIAASAPDQSWFINWADFPSLSVLDNGDWVSFWLQKSAASASPYAYDIYLTRSTDQGRQWSARLLNGDGTASEHGFVSLLPAGGDQVLALWLDGRHSASPEIAKGEAAADDHASHAGAMSLRSALVDRLGRSTQETEIDARTCDCCNTDAVRIGDQTMVVYRDRSEDEIRDTRFSVRDPRGHWSAPQLVHADHWRIAGCPVNGPALAVHGKRLLGVWVTMQGEQLQVRAALGDRSGFGPMIEIESGTETQGRVDAAAFGNQSFLLSWLGADASDSGGTHTAIKIARLDRHGKLHPAQTLVSLPAGRNTGFPRMASNGNTALLVWTEPNAEGSVLQLVRITDANNSAEPGPSSPKYPRSKPDFDRGSDSGRP